MMLLLIDTRWIKNQLIWLIFNQLVSAEEVEMRAGDSRQVLVQSQNKNFRTASYTIKTKIISKAETTKSSRTSKKLVLADATIKKISHVWCFYNFDNAD